MPSRIILLDADTINKIAAGEVVERPASALKELIENALDADSTRIEMELEEGGIRQLRVVDNGWGMNAEEVRYSVERHATSKITQAEDLQRILSFGFRGEALSSMAAVSHLELISRTADQTEGTRLIVAGGEILSMEPIGAPVGTQVTLRDLFYNLPARREFLKRPAAEQRLAIDLVSRLVLANPQVAFRLQCDGRTRLQSSGNNNLLEAIAAVYGPETASQMLFVKQDLESESELSFTQPLESKAIKVWGYVSGPSLTRNNRLHQSFLVNRRWVHSRLLQEAVMEAYHGLLPPQRFPVVILHLEISPEMVDVNIHPAKMEIRFRDEDMIFNQVVKSLRHTLRSPAVITRLDRGASARKDPTKALPRSPSPSATELRREPSLEPLNFSGQPGATEKAADVEPTSRTSDYTLAEPSTPYGENRFSLELLVPKAQIIGTYMIAEGPDGLYILDQHAVHERILYEKIMAGLENDHNYSQAVLFPETIELTPEESERFTRQILFFRNLGFVLEHFGGHTFLLRGIPTFIKESGKEAFMDLLDYLSDKHHLEEPRLYEEMVARLACHQAIKANRVLSGSEMEALILQLAGLNNPYSCPHGRPTILRFTQAELERRFQRR